MDSRNVAHRTYDGMHQFEAITFDFWNTLAREPEGYMIGARIVRLTEVLRLTGHIPDRRAVTDAVTAARDKHISSWAVGEQFLAPEALDYALEVLKIEVDADLRDELVDVFSLADIAENEGLALRTAPGIGPVLEKLSSSGVKIGIICDVGLTPSPSLRAFLESEGLLHHFTGWSFSDEVGHYKPSKEIFTHALETLDVSDPAAVAHVGDLRRTDVAGAIDFGMSAVRYRGLNDDPEHAGPEADAVIDHHDQLDAALKSIAR